MGKLTSVQRYDGFGMAEANEGDYVLYSAHLEQMEDRERLDDFIVKLVRENAELKVENWALQATIEALDSELRQMKGMA